jgi:hypothetical protein
MVQLYREGHNCSKIAAVRVESSHSGEMRSE